jgi:hypothetical protein
MAAATSASAAKIEYIVKAIDGITQMEAEVDVLEKAQRSAEETDRPGQDHIDSRIAAMDAAKDACMHQVRSLSKEELRVLGARTRTRM